MYGPDGDPSGSINDYADMDPEENELPMVEDHDRYWHYRREMQRLGFD